MFKINANYVQNRKPGFLNHVFYGSSAPHARKTPPEYTINKGTFLLSPARGREAEAVRQKGRDIEAEAERQRQRGREAERQRGREAAT